jgi:hypothetical protein
MPVMKKHILLSLTALAITCLAQQPASAWSNIRFKAGVDLNWQSGNNEFLWGAWRSGENGACGSSNCGSYGYGYPGAAMGYGAAPSPYMMGGMGGMGGVAGPYMIGGAGGGLNPAGPAGLNAGKTSPPTGSPPGGVNQTGYPWSYYTSGYQPVAYYYPGYGYPTPSYAPTTYSSTVPSYWYGYGR